MAKAVMIIDDGDENSPTGTLRVVYVGGFAEISPSHALMSILHQKAVELACDEGGKSSLSSINSEELEALLSLGANNETQH